MRELYTQQLETMKTRLIQMGAMCEDAISCSVKGMLHGDAELLKKVESTEMDINQMEREIERLCMRLLLMQQPVASDLRSVSSALKIISDLERIGDQAEDIAEIVTFLKGRTAEHDGNPQSAPLQFADHMDHLFQRRRDQSAESDDIGIMFDCRIDDRLCRHHHTEVDHRTVVALQNDRNDVFTNIVYVAFYGCNHHFTVA